MKGLKWRMGERITGRYRSFQKRAWPTAEYGGHTACMLSPKVHLEDNYGPEGYHPSLKETTILRAKVKNCQSGEYSYLKGEFLGYTKAKEAVERFYTKNPQWLESPPLYTLDTLPEGRYLILAYRSEYTPLTNSSRTFRGQPIMGWRKTPDPVWAECVVKHVDGDLDIRPYTGNPQSQSSTRIEVSYLVKIEKLS